MANEYTEAECLTKLETKFETIEMMILRLEVKFQAYQSNFVSKEMLEEKLNLRDDRIERLEKDKSSYKNNLPFWVTAFLTGISIINAIWPQVK